MVKRKYFDTGWHLWLMVRPNSKCIHLLERRQKESERDWSRVQPRWAPAHGILFGGHVLHPVHDALCRPAPQEARGGPAQGRQRHLRTPHKHGGDDPGQVQPEADEQHLGAVQPLRTTLLPEELRDCRLPGVRPGRRPREVLWTFPLESVALSLLGVFGNGHPRMVTTGRRQTPGNYGQYTDGTSCRL
ncbi:unnamed protein product [Ixodes persulcatus]